MSKKEPKCGICEGTNLRVLHEGDESNCDCVGSCLLVCDSIEDCDGCYVEVKFNLRCFLTGHDWEGCNGSDYEVCDRCFKERGGE
jgi:hypothetical protein